MVQILYQGYIEKLFTEINPGCDKHDLVTYNK